MTPTPQEKQWLRDYLYEALSYRETFDEVYDHILLALEREPAQQFFESTVYKVIDEDFGGSINLLNMEVDCQRTIEQELRSQYWRTFYKWLKLPRVANTLIIASGVFLLGSVQSFRVVLIRIAIVLLIALVPLITVAVRKLTVRFVYHDKKASIRDSAFKWLAYWFIIIGIVIMNPIGRFTQLYLSNLFHYSEKQYMFSLPGRSISTIFMMITIIHMLTLIELYREEFKTRMITN